jgi:hypothetical protein
MTVAYVIAILAALAAFAVLRGIDMRLRLGVSVGILICLVALTTWLVSHVGDQARPGSVEVPWKSADSEPPASKPQ